MGLQMILAAVAKDHGVKYSETNLMRNEQTQYLSLKVAKARLGKTWMSVWPLLPNLTESLLPNLCYALWSKWRNKQTHTQVTGEFFLTSEYVRAHIICIYIYIHAYVNAYAHILMRICIVIWCQLYAYRINIYIYIYYIIYYKDLQQTAQPRTFNSSGSLGSDSYWLVGGCDVCWLGDVGCHHSTNGRFPDPEKSINVQMQ